MGVSLSSIKPYEICSIRPPTENYSLSFRLTRNCYWNRCKFCPVYKFGARFSKRSLEEVKEDIRRARLVDDLLLQEGTGDSGFGYGAFSRIPQLIQQIREETGREFEEEEREGEGLPEDLDPGLVWFLRWFKDKPDLEDSLNHVLTWRMSGTQSCFLGDADSLILKPEFLRETINEIKRQFPTLRRFTVYGRTKTAAHIRKSEELRAFHEAGLNRVHFGLESGCDDVLRFVRKGVTQDEHIQGAVKTREAGLSCGVYVMPGLGGTEWSEEHARDTAHVITRITPDYVRLRSLQVFPQTPLDEAIRSGEFREADEEQVVREIRIMVEEINTETEIVSDSASNLLNINGRLPQDRSAMLREIDRFLSLSDSEKLRFSLEARLHSFVGQYGGLSEDIAKALRPYTSNGRLDVSRIGDPEMEDLIRLIRAKLMP
jgi:radical SAM superfamily enzyme YgiQ (UPF0313 family)